MPSQIMPFPLLRTKSVAFYATMLLASVLASGVATAQSANPVEPNRAAAWLAEEPWRTDRFYLETSVYTRHFHSDPAHVDKQKLILGEWNITEQWLVGAAAFDNSFGQPTQAIYAGWRYRPFASAQSFYLKLAGGVVHGYKDPYRDKIPLNHSGFAPAIIPSAGYCFNRICSELVVFGGAGLLLTLGVTIP